MTDHDPRIVVIGGGTGSIAVLEGLKQRTSDIAAVIGMADDGGSNGVMRDELGVLPASDVWKCMAALSDSQVLGDVFRYRFSEGPFKGHTLGNMLFAASGKVTGSFEKAVEVASDILHIHGRVLPVTYDNVRLQMTWPEQGKSLLGEHIIDVEQFTIDPRQAMLSLVPEAHANPVAVTAIREADLLIIAPGDIYTSIGPQLVIDEIGRAVRESPALKVYVANLVTKRGHTDNFTVGDHADEVERFAGGTFLDYVLFNQQVPTEEASNRYEAAGVHVLPVDPTQLETKQYKAIAGDFLGQIVEADPSETLAIGTRSLIRHDPELLANAIINLYESAGRR